MDLYNLALQAQGLMGAQILLTYDDLSDRTRRRCFRNTIEQLLKWGTTPVLNENDAVANEEISSETMTRFPRRLRIAWTRIDS